MVRRKAREARSGKGARAAGKTAPVALGSRRSSGDAVPSKKRKPGKSLVGRKRNRWGLIATGAVVVVCAAEVIGYAVTRSPSTDRRSGPYLNQLAPRSRSPASPFGSSRTGTTSTAR